MATCLVQLAVTEHVLVADVAPLVALYYLVAHGPRRIALIGLGVAVVGGHEPDAHPSRANRRARDPGPPRPPRPSASG